MNTECSTQGRSHSGNNESLDLAAQRNPDLPAHRLGTGRNLLDVELRLILIVFNDGGLPHKVLIKSLNSVHAADELVDELLAISPVAAPLLAKAVTLADVATPGA